MISTAYARELGRKNGAIRRSRLHSARQKGTHTKEQWLALLELIKGICPRCLEAKSHFHKDHIVCLYHGGSDGIENIQPLCPQCNTSKDGLDETDWLMIRGLR
ncbi:MAG: HNH endonuclease signature motif containing protein [Candidatus Binatia bacterium]|nr:HNH endonuclease signature motif containing protein [Candidatus Binatia bacterium]